MNTTENNKLIAKFMGDIDSLMDKVSFKKNCSVNNLQYHSSWDWLMPVVYEIKWLEDIEEEKTEDIDAGLTNALLEQTFEAVVEFIKFYNENK